MSDPIVHQIGVVAIGRNEGVRLRRCLHSVLGRVAAIVHQNARWVEIRRRNFGHDRRWAEHDANGMILGRRADPSREPPASRRDINSCDLTHN